MKKSVRVGIVAGVAALFLTVASLQSSEPDKSFDVESPFSDTPEKTPSPEMTQDEVPTTSDDSQRIICEPSYPDMCLPTYPPDLDCGEIPYTDFTVLEPDPHGFDRDNDGIGCES